MCIGLSFLLLLQFRIVFKKGREMITLFVIGYIFYLFGGIIVIGHLCDKYLNDDKVCVNCIHLLLGYVWGFLPVTLFFDFK